MSRRYRHRVGFSNKRFGQGHNAPVGQIAEGAGIDPPLGARPYWEDIDAFIAREFGVNGRAKEVRAKLTDDERRRLRITPIGATVLVWR